MTRIESRSSTSQRGQTATRVGLSPTRRDSIGNSPIHRLPVEIFGEIFVILASLAEDRWGWNKILLVCKLWYNIACDVASLWRVIYVSSNQEWLRICLGRAPRCTIDLHIPKLEPAEFDAAKGIIAPHRHRIRALHVQSPHDFLAESIGDFLTEGLQALEELTFSPVEWRVKEETSLGLSFTSFPCLRTLVLSGVSIPREPKFYRNLRTLELHEECSDQNDFTIDDLLDALHAASPNLEELDLSRFDLNPSKHKQSSLRKINLERLRSFYLDNELRVVSELTPHLRIPPNAKLHLCVLLPQGVRDVVNRLLAAILPPSIRIVFDAAEELYVSMEKERFIVRVFDPARTSDNLQACGRRFQRINITIQGTYNSYDALPAVATFCTSQRLTQLTVRSATVAHPAASWKALLGAFPLLEILSVEQCRLHVNNAAGRAFQALRSERPTESASSSSVSNSRETPPCPLLKVVNLEALTTSNEAQRDIAAFFELVVDCLRSRVGQAGRLETLYFQRFPTRYFTGTEQSLVLLRGLVDKVDF